MVCSRGEPLHDGRLEVLGRCKVGGFEFACLIFIPVVIAGNDGAGLRSSGYRRGDIGAIFLWQGAMIAGVGSLIGCGAGSLLTLLVSHIPIRVRGLIYANHF